MQDALISPVREAIRVPELATEVPAAKGFSVIATANTRDRGERHVGALKRRFNMVVLPTPNTLETEVEIVRKRVKELGTNLELKAAPPAEDAVTQVVTIFRELRAGQTLDGKNKLKRAERGAVHGRGDSVLANGMALAGNFGHGEVTAHDLAAGPGGGRQGRGEGQGRPAGVPDQRPEEARGRLAAAVHGLCGAQLVKAGVHVFGVRHLSAGGAWHLRHPWTRSGPRWC